MNKVSGQLTVFFESPFWIGVYERRSDGLFQTCKITFYKEPKEQEVYSFLLNHYSSLNFTRSEEDKEKEQRFVSTKKKMKHAKAQMEKAGIGTKSQEALKLERQCTKLAKKKRSSELEREKKECRFLQKQQKRKQKHKGR